ncbi:SGNH/GDSL hydrolase family protein [Streptomyces sp. NBC_00286]|uniref:SGNH/GDSL hydrolase family protein n=1 Tax=Streptomyces sp. NBC_00286 TaxID=2975701 RepID=UPI002E2DC51D|nr:SGNH/GDSL hydrolase family protein [Streptomyces sp. NBC_00286]
MGRTWAGGVLAGLLLLAACGDPSSGPGTAPPERPASATPAAKDPGPSPSSTTQQQRPPASAAADAEAEVPAKRPTVLYLGDSLAMENQKVLGELLQDELKARYTSAPYSGTTLCDYLQGTGEKSLVPDRDKAAALVRSLRPDFVVLQFWANAWDYTWCMDGITHGKDPATYFARFTSDARKLTDQITNASGAKRTKVVWVLQGPDPITPDRVRRVNAIYEQQAEASGGLVADAGKEVGPADARYTWVQHLPCTAYERDHPAYCTQPSGNRTALHRDDDYLHFCLAPTTAKSRPCPVPSPGILRMTRAITKTLAAAVN